MPKIILYLFVSVALLTACSEETQKEKQVVEKPVIVPSARPTIVKEQQTFEPHYEKLNPEISNYVLSLDSVYARTPFYTKLDQRLIFMVCKGVWQMPSDTFKNDKGFLGLVDEKGTVLLAPEYYKIYNPDLTAKGYIEIEKNGKRGLYNYLLNAVIAPQFDVIFPSEDGEFSALGKKGNAYYGIQGKQVIPYTGEVPTYNAFSEKWKFNAMKNVTYWNDSYATFYEGDPEEGIGFVFTPSYFQQLDFLPEVVTWVGTTDKTQFGIIEAKGSIVEAHSLGEKISALITSFYEEGVDGRGWQIERNHIATVDDHNNVIGKEMFFQNPDRGQFYYCDENSTGFKYLENNLLEVRDIRSLSDYTVYDYMTTYEYYKINLNGRIDRLESNRIFDVTKYVKINASYFNGCFSKSAGDIIAVEGEEGNMWLSDHLSIEDLDLMRNEIFAEYGMKFKSEKWKKHFENQKWYHAQYDNVDQLLTEIDKHNLKVILAAQAQMKGRESQVTNRRLFMYAAAG